MRTGRMGKLDDPMAVVDSKARVIGTQGLRVVDASSFALLPPGHPESTVCECSAVVPSDHFHGPLLTQDIQTDVIAEKIAADMLSG